MSRARHGLFILGNAPQLACQNTFWEDCLAQLESADCVGSELAMFCERHQTGAKVSEPGDVARVAPLGEFFSNLSTILYVVRCETCG